MEKKKKFSVTDPALSWMNVSRDERDAVIFTLDAAIRNMRLGNQSANSERIMATLAARKLLASPRRLTVVISWILPILIGIVVGFAVGSLGVKR